VRENFSPLIQLAANIKIYGDNKYRYVAQN
jgi:hypothetical protein